MIEKIMRMSMNRKNKPRIFFCFRNHNSRWIIIENPQAPMTSLIKYWFQFFFLLSSWTARVTDGFAHYGMPCKYTGKHLKTRASVTWRCVLPPTRPDSLSNCATRRSSSSWSLWVIVIVLHGALQSILVTRRLIMR